MLLTIHLFTLAGVIACVALGCVAVLFCVVMTAPGRSRKRIAKEREGEAKREQAVEQMLRDDVAAPPKPRDETYTRDGRDD